jgi:O-antigen ligase
LERVLAKSKDETLGSAFFWLSGFYFFYCARPADSIPGLALIPLVKITLGLTALSLIVASRQTPRRLRDLPKEGFYLLAFIVLMFASAVLSPVWKGGAFFTTLEFSKLGVAWAMTFLLVTTFQKLRRIMFLQCASVAFVSIVAIAKGHSVPRLFAVLGGTYSNPNDLAFAIVLSLPFCLAFLLTAKRTGRKVFWCFGMMMMALALLLTASRAGFIDLLVAGACSLWYFGVKGKRLYLIVVTAFLAVVLLFAAGKSLMKRFAAFSSENVTNSQEASAYESFEERKTLMLMALEAIRDYPILGLGASNFSVYSKMWKDVHATYLQIAADGGIPVLILYLMFFARGFANLNSVRKDKTLSAETLIFAGALTSSLVGFAVGACFAPEAYQYFPYFIVCYTSAFVAMTNQRLKTGASEIKLFPQSRRFAQA